MTDTYTDPSGRRVCTRSWTGPAATVGGPGTRTMSETLYAYDHRDSLVLVVQPEGTAALRALSPADRVITLGDDPVNANNDIFSGYCFSFTYDGWGNILSEHTPGGGTVQYAYDARDRLVLRTDQMMSPNPGSAGGKMVLTLHDQYDRVVEERYVSSPQASFETLRSNFRSLVTHTLSPSYITGILPTQQVLRTAEYFPYGSITYATSGDGAFMPDPGIVADSDVEKTNVKGLLRQETVYPAPGPDGTIPAGAPSVTRYYHYDYNGRVVQMKEVWSDGHSRRLSTKYSFTGDVLATKETLSGADTISITTTYTRDSRGRILSVGRDVGGVAMEPVTYSYDELGRLVSKSFGSSASASESRAYDIHGWTTSISASIGNTPVFSEGLRYASAAKDQSAVRYDGNISEITAAHGTLSNDTYAYSYDGMKRLLGADRYTGASPSSSLTRTEKNISYDRNGNITDLKRYGDTGLDNDLSFTLTGNMMTGLSDAGTPGGSFTYSYDAMGNQTSDGRKGLLFSYNILNLPCGVTSATSGSLTYTYLSDGTKVSAVREDGSGKRYLGSAVYSVPGSGGTEALESAAWDEGRIFFDVEVPVDSTGNGLVVVDSIPGIGCYRDCWYVTDHLGNVRSVVDISSSLAAPQVVERNDYLPYGTRMSVGAGTGAGTGSGDTVLEVNRYRLGGKEEQVFGSLDLGKVDFGARMYDPFTARWTTIDPMAAKYVSMSPYSYCAGNPVAYSDLLGMSPIYSPDGEFLGTDDGGLRGMYIIMDASFFSQGMTHDDALSNSMTGPISKDVSKKVKSHFHSLKSRPDYDGFVTISEGLNWARTHIGAKDNPTPDNCLYIDASKIDYGHLSVENSGLLDENPKQVNLFDYFKWYSIRSLHSTYALGNTNILLVDAEKGEVQLISDTYDWDYHNPFINGKPQGSRDKLVFWERRRSAVDDRHGFKLRFYGTGIIPR